MMSYSEEETVDIDMTNLLIRFSFLVNEVYSLNLTFSGELERIMLEQHFNFWIVQYALLHDFRSSKIGFTNYHVHFFA